MNYYNEFDPKAAAWLRQLVVEGLIPAGDIDERSICDVHPGDLAGYTQCHFFAGIGGWSYALALAGWPADRPIWTGSCPCQPFSAAGRRAGAADARHLWPEFYRLIAECRPPVVAGEQVASKLGRLWLDAVRADLEGLAYGVGAADLCAASVGAPHIRQRVWWVAERQCERPQLQPVCGPSTGQRDFFGARERGEQLGALGAGIGGLAHAHQSGPQGQQLGRDGAHERVVGTDGVDGGVADAERDGRKVALLQCGDRDAARGIGVEAVVAGGDSALVRPRLPHLHWTTPDWLWCRDEKWRPVESGTFPLVDGLPRGVVPSGDLGDANYAQNTGEARVARLQGYGNAIVPQVAAVFLRSYLEATE